MAQLVRDCSKGKSSTFNQIGFPIIQEIETKIKNKNLALRKKARVRIADRIRNTKFEEDYSRKQSLLYHKFEKESLNYIDVYQPQRPTRDPYTHPHPEHFKMDDKEEEAIYHVYLLLRKKKTIFKVEEVKRKVRGKDHSKLSQKGQNSKNKKKLEEKIKVQEDTNRVIEMAQQLIQGPEVLGASLPTLQIKCKEEDMELPKIDRSEQQSNKKQVQDNQQEGELQPIFETERISQIESKSQISESRRNRSDIRSMGIQKQKEEFSPQKKSKHE